MPTQLSLEHIDVKQAASLDDFCSSGFVPVLSAVQELIKGNVPELYVFGESGSGKSHLLSAIYRHYTQAGRTAIFLSMAELIETETQALFGLEMFNLIMIDDIQLIKHKDDWQEALFHLINRGRQANCQFIYAANAPPTTLGFSLLDLITRLSQALNFRLPDGVDIEDRRALLASLLRQKGWQLPPAITDCLINEGPHHVGDMMQVLNAIIPHFNHTRGKLSTKQLESLKDAIRQQSFLIELTDFEDNTDTQIPMTYY